MIGGLVYECCNVISDISDTVAGTWFYHKSKYWLLCDGLRLSEWCFYLRYGGEKNRCHLAHLHVFDAIYCYAVLWFFAFKWNADKNGRENHL